MIWRWTLKSLLMARMRTLGSVLAVSAAFLLITTFKAVWEAESRQLVAYIQNTQADVWVMQPHVSNMHMASSFISEGKRIQIAEVEGVESVGAILYLNTFVRVGGEQWLSYVVGLDEDTPLGGPWSMARGKPRPAPGELVIPETLARITGSRLGDPVQIADKRFSIVGMSADTFSAANPITFMHVADLAELLSLVGYESYVLVKAKPGVDTGLLAERIQRQISDVRALTTSVFARNDRMLAKQMGSEVIGLLTAICSGLALILVAFSLYLHTSRQKRELAVLKALGFNNGQVTVGVLLQSAVLTMAAFAIGSLATVVLSLLTPTIAPVLSLDVTLESLVEIGLAGLAVSAGATLFVLRRIIHVDPLSVFHQ